MKEGSKKLGERYDVDLSRIEARIWKENWLLLLGFPQPEPIFRGYVPLRVVAREFFYFEYDPLQEGQLTAKVPAGVINGAASNTGINDLGFVQPALPGSQFLTGKPFDVFYIQPQSASKLYQMFLGISPSALRFFREQPATVGQNNLEIDRWASNRLEFGWIDGFDSPLLSPSPQSEIVQVPGMDIAFGYANPLPTNINPLLLFVMNHVQVAIVQDVDLVDAMLRGKVPVAIKTIGGLSSYNYDVKGIYGVSPVALGSSKTAIANALGVPLEKSSPSAYIAPTLTR